MYDIPRVVVSELMGDGTGVPASPFGITGATATAAAGAVLEALVDESVLALELACFTVSAFTAPAAKAELEIKKERASK